jgi:hypothetical protein
VRGTKTGVLTIPAGFFDIKEVVFCRNLTQRQDLNAVFFAVWGVHEQVAEVAQAFGVPHCLTH